MKKNDEISTSTSAPVETTENFDAQSQGNLYFNITSPHLLYHF